MTKFHFKKRIYRIKKEKNINNKKYEKQMNINTYMNTTFPVFTIIQQYFKFVYTFLKIYAKIIFIYYIFWREKNDRKNYKNR